MNYILFIIFSLFFLTSCMKTQETNTSAPSLSPPNSTNQWPQSELVEKISNTKVPENVGTSFQVSTENLKTNVEVRPSDIRK